MRKRGPNGNTATTTTATVTIFYTLITFYLFHYVSSFGTSNTNCCVLSTLPTISLDKRSRFGSVRISGSSSSSSRCPSFIKESSTRGSPLQHKPNNNIVRSLSATDISIIMTSITDESHVFPLSSFSFFSREEWQPLYLSCIAGASTSIGAAVVFLQPRRGNKRIVPPGMMAFSLALAASVMLTVSVVSILPECFILDDGSGNSYRWIPFWSELMLYRVVFFMLGSILYFGLSWCLNIPEPQDVWLLQQDQEHGGGGNRSGGFFSRDITNATIDDGMLIGMDDGPIVEEDTNTTTTSNAITTTNTGSKNEGPQPNIVDMDIEYSYQSSSHSKNTLPIISRLKKSKSHELVPTPTQPCPPERNNNGKYKSSRSSCNMTLSNWTKSFTGKDLKSKQQQKAWRVAILLFTSMLVHNFPEGLAVAASALESTNLGWTVTVGIMIHNIPEGIAIAIPCLAARPDQPWLGFVLASISGLAEPMGAFVALMFLRGLDDEHGTSFMGDGGGGGVVIMSLENVLAFVAGIMVTVALWELFPEAMRHSKEDKKNSHFWYGTFAGMVIMVLTELNVN